MIVNMVQLYWKSFRVSLKTGPDIGDGTPALTEIVRESGIENGSLTATVVGSTGSLTTIEYEPGVVEDLKRAIGRLAPQGMEYAHELAWHDGNGHSHVQAAMMGPSIALAIRSGRLALGSWQQVVAINHDNRPRRPAIDVTVTGI